LLVGAAAVSASPGRTMTLLLPLPAPPKPPSIVEAVRAPQEVQPVPTSPLIDIEARILTVDKSFSRDFGTFLAASMVNSTGNSLRTTSNAATSGLTFLMH